MSPQPESFQDKPGTNERRVHMRQITEKPMTAWLRLTSPYKAFLHICLNWPTQITSYPSYVISYVISYVTSLVSHWPTQEKDVGASYYLILLASDWFQKEEIGIPILEL